MKMIEVVHIVENLELGGLEQIVESIATGLSKDRFKIEVWSIAGGGQIADRLKSNGVTVRIFRMFSYYNIASIIILARKLRLKKPKIIHTHGYFASVIGRVAAILASVPIIVIHYHTTYHHMTLRNKVIDRFLNMFTDKIIVISQAVKQSFIENGYNCDKAEVIYNGVNIEEFHLRSYDGIKQVITIIASLVEHKGHIFLLQAMKRIIAKYPHACLWVVGDGPLREKLQDDAQRMHIANNINFMGRRTNIGDILSESSIFVSSSLREGLGIAAIEAMASGIPVVATDVGGLPEVVLNNITGYIVPPGDPTALVNAIEILIANPELIIKMGRKGRERFEHVFSRVTMIRKLENLYEGLISEKTKCYGESW